MSGTIGRAAAVVSIGILASRVLGFLRNVLLYGLLGRDLDTGLYVAAFTIPDFLFFLMAGGYLSITLVPILSAALADDGEQAARESFTAVFRGVGLLLVVATVALLAAAEPVTRLVFPEIGAVDRLVGLTRIALASQVFFGLGTLLMAAQSARRRFLVPTLAPLLYNLGIIGGGALGAAVGEATPEAFLWGGLAGAALGNFALQLWGAAPAGMRLARGVRWRHPALGEYLALAFPLMVGQSVVALDEQWPRLIGQVAGEGAIAALYGARQLNMLPVGVIAQAAGVAAFPFLAGLFAEKRLGELDETVTRSVRTAVAFGALAAAAVAALATPVVRVAYQRGEFLPEDTAVMGPLLALYALSIPFWAAHQVYTRGFYAMRRMWLPVGIGSAVTVVTVPALLLTVSRAGAAGVAAVSSASVAVYTLAVGFAWRRQAERAQEMLPPLARLAVMSLAAFVSASGAAAALPDGSTGAGILRLAVGGTAAVAAYLVVGRLLGSPEVDALLRLRPGASSRTDPEPPPAGGR